jgi:hypothetical protein
MNIDRRIDQEDYETDDEGFPMTRNFLGGHLCKK